MIIYLQIPENVLENRARINPTCGLYSLARGAAQRVISFSIYGPLRGGYFNGIVRNLELAREIYPEYAVRLYHDRTKQDSKEDILKLCSILCEYPQLDLCESRDIGEL